MACNCRRGKLEQVTLPIKKRGKKRAREEEEEEEKKGEEEEEEQKEPAKKKRKGKVRWIGEGRDEVINTGGRPLASAAAACGRSAL